MRGAGEAVASERGHADVVTLRLRLRARLVRGPDFVRASPFARQRDELVRNAASCAHTQDLSLVSALCLSVPPRSLTSHPPPWPHSFAPLLWQSCWPMPRPIRLDVAATRPHPIQLHAGASEFCVPVTHVVHALRSAFSLAHR